MFPAQEIQNRGSSFPDEPRFFIWLFLQCQNGFTASIVCIDIMRNKTRLQVSGIAQDVYKRQGLRNKTCASGPFFLCEYREKNANKGLTGRLTYVINLCIVLLSSLIVFLLRRRNSRLEARNGLW